MRTILLICGILSALLFGAINVFVAWQGTEYSSVTQTVSELSAIGAPTRSLWIALGIPYAVLAAAFGAGVWASAGDRRPLRVVGSVLIAHAVLGLFWPPMHSRDVLAAGGATLTDTLHLVFAGVTVLLMLLAIGSGAVAFGKRFRVYSLVTIATLLVFGVLTALDAPRVEANLPTPWVGVSERINIGAFYLWVVVLALALLHEKPASIGDRLTQQTSAFKSSQGAATFLLAYDDAMKSWPVAYEATEAHSRFGTTHVVVSGPADAPPLVLLHGYWSTLTMWTPNVADLSRGHRVYAIDVIGQPGRSIPREPIRSPADTVAWLTDTLNGLRLDRVTLVGMSYGGWLALNYAIAAPERVQKLVLLSPAASFQPLVRQFGLRGMLMVSVPTRGTVNSFMRWLGFGAALGAANRVPELMYLGIKHFRIPRETAAVAPTVFADGELRTMRVPTLVLIGEREVIYDPSAALARARRLLPDVEGDLVPQSSHDMCASQHELVDRRILAFLKGAGIRRATPVPECVVA